MFANIQRGIGDIDEAYKYIETNNTKQEFIEAI